jgi:hypothetical protein
MRACKTTTLHAHEATNSPFAAWCVAEPQPGVPYSCVLRRT